MANKSKNKPAKDKEPKAELQNTGETVPNIEVTEETLIGYSKLTKFEKEDLEEETGSPLTKIEIDACEAYKLDQFKTKKEIVPAELFEGMKKVLVDILPTDKPANETSNEVTEPETPSKDPANDPNINEKQVYACPQCHYKTRNENISLCPRHHELLLAWP